MTAATSQPGLWVTDPAGYRRKLEGLLGKQDPIQVLSQTPDAFARIVEQSPTRLLRTRPFPGKWTPLEVIGHLSDTEWVYGYRMRLILCEDRPTILGMDQDLWVTEQKHNEREPKELVEAFRSMRKMNVFLWRTMGPPQFARVGRHNERGEESLGQMLRMLAGHDLSHIDQINRYLEAVKAQK